MGSYRSTIMVVAPVLWDSFAHKNPTGPAYFAPQTSTTEHPKVLFALRISAISTLLALLVHLFGQSQKVNSRKFAEARPVTPSGAPAPCSSGTPRRRCVLSNAPRARSPHAVSRTPPTATGRWPTARS